MSKSIWKRFKEKCIWFFCMPAYSFEKPPPRKRRHGWPPTPPPKDAMGIKERLEVHQFETKVDNLAEDGASEEETASYAWPQNDLTAKESDEPVQNAGIRFRVAQHQAEVIERDGGRVTSAEEVLDTVWQPTTVKSDYETRETKYLKCKEIYQTSMDDSQTDFSSFLPKRNGFVHTVLQAYNHHHELVIRPDDIWIAILSQLNLYVNANAEALRDYFVSHEGRKRLRLEYEGGTRYTLDYITAAHDFSEFLRKRIKDPDLVDVILPNFSTTSVSDTTICSVLMMSTLKAYFSYEIEIRCGIPAVTLLGDRSDYELILTKLDKLEELGSEAKMFTSLLRPIVHEFIASFNAISAGLQPNMDFWGKICHEHSMGSGSNVLSGWLSAFCVWDNDGKWQLSKLEDLIWDPWQKPDDEGSLQSSGGIFDASPYGGIIIKDIPVGFSDVEVLVIEGGVNYDCLMVAGHVGAQVSKKNGFEDTLQPSAQWFMIEIERFKENM